MFRRILVPLDGSLTAENALPRAIELAKRFESTLDLLTVALPHGGYVTSSGLHGDESREKVRVWMNEYLEEVEQRIRDAGFDGKVCRHVLPPGNVVKALLRHGIETEVDLAIMTTQGRGGIERAWLGSTADGLVRSAPWPVILIRPGKAVSGEVDLGRSVLPFSRVLVPLDGSGASERILPLADALAGPDASMILLRAVAPFTPRGYAPYLPHIIEDEREREAAREQAETYLKGVADRFAPGRGTLELEVPATRLDAPDAILEAAEESDVDLIAMSTAGRGGVARLLIGSVADKVIRGSHVPLLLFREAAGEASG